MTEPESYWKSLLQHLDKDGLLSIQVSKLTPSEIARQVMQRTGDQRVNTFVWGYYYPLVYGKVPGALTKKQAKALVDSFDKPPAPDELELMPRTTPRPKCAVCGTRWPAAEETR